MNDIKAELAACLALQNEIDEKTMELRRRYCDVIQAEREKGNQEPIVVGIGQQVYELRREDDRQRIEREALGTARKLGGFYIYRLFKIGRFIE